MFCLSRVRKSSLLYAVLSFIFLGLIFSENSFALQSRSPASKLSSWDLSGAMAARYQKKSTTASLSWLQQGAGNYQIRLSGPIGSGTILLKKSGQQVSLQDGAKRYTSSNAESLLAKHTGLRIPVSALFYWVQGLPAPGSALSSKYDGNHHLLLLKQAGYTIEYTQYTQVQGRDLPTRIQLQGKDISMKVVIKRWHF